MLWAYPAPLCRWGPTTWSPKWSYTQIFSAFLAITSCSDTGMKMVTLPLTMGLHAELIFLADLVHRWLWQSCSAPGCRWISGRLNLKQSYTQVISLYLAAPVCSVTGAKIQNSQFNLVSIRQKRRHDLAGTSAWTRTELNIYRLGFSIKKIFNILP